MTPIQQALEVLRQGGVIAHPAEGVWGLGCDYQQQQAAERIRTIKKRPQMPYIVLFASLAHLQRVLPATASHSKVLSADYPRARSWRIATGTGAIPHWVRAADGSVVIRCTRHPLLIELIEAMGSALISTSANLHGQPAPNTQEQIAAPIMQQIDYLLDGATLGQSGASEIYDLETMAKLR